MAGAVLWALKWLEIRPDRVPSCAAVFRLKAALALVSVPPA
jgi:hypothetical protein